MDNHLRILLDEHGNDPAQQYRLAGIDADSAKEFILAEMEIANDSRDWDAWNTLLRMAASIRDPAVKAETLNALLVMPGHELHQAVTKEIQRLKSPTSVPFIRSMLASGFDMLKYTSSEPQAIAKWFSHALARINTPEAIAVISEYAGSSDTGVAGEMAYRLETVKSWMACRR